MPKHLLRNLLLAVTLVTASGCGIIDMIYLPPAEDTAQEIFEAANDAMADHNYVRAVQLYNKLKDAYPDKKEGAERYKVTPITSTRNTRWPRRTTRTSSPSTPATRPSPTCFTRSACRS